MVENKLKGIMAQMENPSLAPYAKEGEVLLRVTAKAKSLSEAQQMVEPVIQMVKETLGDVVYGVDVDSLESLVLQLTQDRHLTFGAAESCTGGLFSKRVTDLSGASVSFKGSIISYSPEAKMQLLHIPQETLTEKGTVSPETAIAMAKGARDALHVDLAVGITGVAGPLPDERNQPVGLVYTALAAADGVWVRKLYLGRDRNWIRIMAVHYALDMMRRYLTGLKIEQVEEIY